MVTGHVPPGRENRRTHIYSRSTSSYSCTAHKGDHLSWMHTVTLRWSYAYTPTQYPPPTHICTHRHTHGPPEAHQSRHGATNLLKDTEGRKNSVNNAVFRRKEKKGMHLVILSFLKLPEIIQMFYKNRSICLDCQKTLVRTHSGRWKRFCLL